MLKHTLLRSRHISHSSYSNITTMPSTMKAAMMYGPGDPSVLKIEERPTPSASKGQVLIRVKAFGLNRSEMFTRQGHSPDIQWPRILGIEAVGIVEDAPGGEFEKGTTVATAVSGSCISDAH